MSDVDKHSIISWFFTNIKYLCNQLWTTNYGIDISRVGTTKQYIANQEEHHKVQSFEEEFLRFLKLYEIEYDER